MRTMDPFEVNAPREGPARIVASVGRSCLSLVVDTAGLGLLVAGLFGVAAAMTQSVLMAGPILTLCSTAIVSGVVVLCRWRG